MTEVQARKSWSRVAAFLALEPNVIAVSTAMFLLALGENLWQKFLPKYLQALGAPIRAVGLFGSIEDFLDGVYQYPGGWLGDRVGRRASLLGFVVVAAIGYAIYGFARSWPWIIAGLKDTLEDRALMLVMLRRRRGEAVARIGRPTDGEA